MDLKRRFIVLAAIAIMVTAGAAHAVKTETIVKADNKASFAAAVIKVRAQMQEGGRYGHISPQERQSVDENLAQMQALLDKFGAVSAMDQDHKVELFNRQEVVNTTLTHRDNQRLVCENDAPTGSLIRRSSCRTYGDIMQSRHDTQKALQDMKQVQNVRRGN